MIEIGLISSCADEDDPKRSWRVKLRRCAIKLKKRSLGTQAREETYISLMKHGNLV
jgi:hypothetical protein